MAPPLPGVMGAKPGTPQSKPRGAGGPQLLSVPPPSNSQALKPQQQQQSKKQKQKQKISGDKGKTGKPRSEDGGDLKGFEDDDAATKWGGKGREVVAGRGEWKNVDLDMDLLMRSNDKNLIGLISFEEFDPAEFVQKKRKRNKRPAAAEQSEQSAQPELQQQHQAKKQKLSPAASMPQPQPQPQSQKVQQQQKMKAPPATEQQSQKPKGQPIKDKKASKPQLQKRQKKAAPVVATKPAPASVQDDGEAAMQSDSEVEDEEDAVYDSADDFDFDTADFGDDGGLEIQVLDDDIDDLLEEEADSLNGGDEDSSAPVPAAATKQKKGKNGKALPAEDEVRLKGVRRSWSQLRALHENPENFAAFAGINTFPWEQLGVHPWIQRGLQRLGFSKPTPIQEQVLPAAIGQLKDVVGAAQTGSGKTLAFGIPMVDRLLRLKLQTEAVSDSTQPATAAEHRVRGLILTPTRELALQIHEHLEEISRYTPIKIISVVGGIAEQKQIRLLSSYPDIMIATPGRLWALISESAAPVLEHLTELTHLVLDEADRMLSSGHFRELQKVLRYTWKQVVSADGDEAAAELEGAVSGRKRKRATSVAAPVAAPGDPLRQTFLFSATMTLGDEGRRKLKGKQKRRAGGAAEDQDERARVLDKYNKFMRFRKSQVQMVDCTHEKHTARELQESIIRCVADDKDAMLYYCLRKRQGTVLVFVNSISTVRRITGMLKMLRLPAFAMHAKMQQRARLKNLDRFRSSQDGIIVCTDVAARGLDLPDVQLVLHYHLPMTSEIYVHRSGRTARAGRSGSSIAIVDPTEDKAYRIMCQYTNRLEGLDEYQVNHITLRPLRDQIKIAIKLEQVDHNESHRKRENNWLRQQAEFLEVDSDDEMLQQLEDGSSDEDENPAKRRERLRREQEIRQLRAQLESLLDRDAAARGNGKRVGRQGGLVDFD